MQPLLTTLKHILQSYSQLPMSLLFDKYLMLNLFIFTDTKIAIQFLSCQNQITKYKQQVFIKSSINNKIKKFYIYIAINHQILLELHKKLFNFKRKNINNKNNKFNIQQEENSQQFVENVICLTENNEIIDNLQIFKDYTQNIQNNNQSNHKNRPIKKGQPFTQAHTRLNNHSKPLQYKIKGIFLNIPYIQGNYVQLTTRINLFLSIFQLYHSHINLILNIHQQIPSLQHLYNLIYLSQSQQEFQQDQQNQLISKANFTRIFYHGLPYKVTKDTIKKYGQVERYNWGEIMRIRNGMDGVIFWFLQNTYPIIYPQQNMNMNMNMNKPLIPSSSSCSYQKYLTVTTFSPSYLILKLKKLSKQPIQSLSFTVIILNFSHQFSHNYTKIFQLYFDEQINRFKSIKLKNQQQKMFDKINQEIQRLCQLLNVDSYHVTKWILMEEKGKNKNNNNNNNNNSKQGIKQQKNCPKQHKINKDYDNIRDINKMQLQIQSNQSNQLQI